MNIDQLSQQFNNDWWAAQNAAVRAIRDLPLSPMSIRLDPAIEAQNKGALVDLNIVVYGWDAFLVHQLRTNFGVPYVSPIVVGTGFNGLSGVPQPFPAAPRGTLPTVVVDPDQPEATLNRLHALYPPPPPPPPPPDPGQKIVGNWVYGNVYGLGPGAHPDTVADGKEYMQDGKVFVAHVSIGLMGWQCYFTSK